jgi:hypothetical protein
MDKILGITRVEKEAGKYNPEGAILKQERQTVQLLPHEKTELEILERNIEKNGFDCIIRMFYHVQDAEKFHLNRGVFTVVNAMKSFGKPGFNEFKFDTITVDGDTPFLDPTGEYTEGGGRGVSEPLSIKPQSIRPPRISHIHHRATKRSTSFIVKFCMLN